MQTAIIKTDDDWEALAARLEEARDCLMNLGTTEMLTKAMMEVFPGEIAVVSSFGAEAAVLLDHIARVDASAPVLFLDTGKHFPETLDYRDMLVDRLGLRNVRTQIPSFNAVAEEDPDSRLWHRDADHCCDIRKVRPLETALGPYNAWISGRKRFQSSFRQSLSPVEIENGRLKLNPLADWTAEDIEGYFDNYGLPRHPLWEDGYLSIGCAVCTKKPVNLEDARSGRWANLSKSECGIHNGKRRNQSSGFSPFPAVPAAPIVPAAND